MRKYFWNLKNCANICTNKSQKIIMPQMFSQLFVHFTNFFAKICAKKGANFLWILYAKRSKYFIFLWCVLFHSLALFLCFLLKHVLTPRQLRSRWEGVKMFKCRCFLDSKSISTSLLLSVDQYITFWIQLFVIACFDTQPIKTALMEGLKHYQLNIRM